MYLSVRPAKYGYFNDAEGTLDTFSESGVDIFVTETFNRNVTEKLAALTGVNYGQLVRTSIEGQATSSGTSISDSFSSSDYEIDVDWTYKSKSDPCDIEETDLYYRHDYSENKSHSEASYDVQVDFGKDTGLQNRLIGIGTSYCKSGYDNSYEYHWECSGCGGCSEYSDSSSDETESDVVTYEYDKMAATVGFGQGKASAPSGRYGGFYGETGVSRSLGVASPNDPGGYYYGYSYYGGYYYSGYYGSYYGGYDYPNSQESVTVSVAGISVGGSAGFGNFAEVDVEAMLTPPPAVSVPAAGGINPLTVPNETGGSSTWAGTKAFFGSLGTSLYDIGNHVSFGSLDASRYNAQTEASGERLYNVAKNLGYSDASVAGGLGLAQALAGEVVGTNNLAEGIVGYDLGTNTLLDGEERFGKAAMGTAQVAATLTGGLKIAGIDTLGSSTKVSSSVSTHVKDLGNDIKNWLGEDSRAIMNGSGDIIFQSKDGLREIRFDFNNYHPHDNPHIHVIEYQQMKNRKILIDDKRIFPETN